MKAKANILKKVYLFFFLLVLFGAGLIGQIVNIQFFSKTTIEKNVAVTTAQYRPVPADRGDIYASDGSLLATSLTYYTVAMDLASDALTDENFDQNLAGLCDSLAVLLPNKSAKRYREELIQGRKSGNRWYVLSTKMPYPDFKRLRKFPLIELGKYKSGLVYVKDVRRKRPFGILAERTIGSKAPVGLEGAFDMYLMGIDGEQFQRRAADGTWVPVGNRNSVEPKDGYDIYSTIDVNIQEVAENALKEQLIYNKADYGCAVVMEVKTGKVRAIANLKVDSLGNASEYTNYAVGDAVEPGSTFKLASMMALLEDGAVSLNDKVDVGYGVYKVYDRKVRDSHLYSEKRTMSAREVFIESSNVGTVKLVEKAYKSNPQAYIDRLYGFGLHNKLGLDILGESAPVIKDPNDKSKWYGTTLQWTSYGYETQFTPIQILAFYNAVANDGKMVKPYFVEKIANKKRVVEEFGPVVLNSSICSKSTIEQLQDLLLGVVEEGTAKQPFKNSPYKVAGKTGTAQINYGRRKEGDKTQYRGSFCGYFPADNPVYSCIVVVTNPKENGIYGGSIAAPAFRKISDKIYAMDRSLRTSMPSENLSSEVATKAAQGFEISKVAGGLAIPSKVTPGTEWVKTAYKSEGLVANEKHVQNEGVPNVKGLTLRDALYLLENEGLVVVVNGKGAVANQSIQPGKKIVPGQIIEITLK